MKTIFNLFQNIPESSEDELFQTIVESKNIRIERILSYGQKTPEDYWYDQEEEEFVLLLEGEAKIEYENREIYHLKRGDTLFIKAHQKHKVVYTANPTIWLAIFIKPT